MMDVYRFFLRIYTVPKFARLTLIILLASLFALAAFAQDAPPTISIRDVIQLEGAPDDTTALRLGARRRRNYGAPKSGGWACSPRVAQLIQAVAPVA